MALPKRDDDYVVHDDDWNTHVEAINNANDKNREQDERLDDLEGSGEFGFDAPPDWLDLELGDDFETWGDTPQYRKIGQAVWLRGGVQRKDGEDIGNGDEISTLPEELRPDVSSTVHMAAVSSAAGSRTQVAVRVSINTSGKLYMYSDDDHNNPPWVSLFGIMYWVD